MSRQSNVRIRIKIASYDSEHLEKACQLIYDSAKRTGVRVQGPIPLPSRKYSCKVLISPHVNKKARDQYDIITRRRLIDIIDPAEKTIESLTKIDLPSLVKADIKVIGNKEKNRVSKKKAQG